MSENSKQPPGTERARDEKRGDRGSVYGGQNDWNVADERGEQRFGVARNDDADSSELIGRAHGPVGAKGSDEDDALSDVADEDVADTEGTSEIESGGDRAGMNRGEKPRKAKRREK